MGQGHAGQPGKGRRPLTTHPASSRPRGRGNELIGLGSLAPRLHILDYTYSPPTSKSGRSPELIPSCALVTAALSNSFLPSGSFQDQTTRAGGELDVYVFLSNTLLAQATVNISTGAVTVS